MGSFGFAVALGVIVVSPQVEDTSSLVLKERRCCFILQNQTIDLDDDDEDDAEESPSEDEEESVEEEVADTTTDEKDGEETASKASNRKNPNGLMATTKMTNGEIGNKCVRTWESNPPLTFKKPFDKGGKIGDYYGEIGNQQKSAKYADLIASCDTGSRYDWEQNQAHETTRFLRCWKDSTSISQCSPTWRKSQSHEALLCIIDCDMEGQADLIGATPLFPKDYVHESSERCVLIPDEVNDMVLAFIDLLHQHKAEHPMQFVRLSWRTKVRFTSVVNNHYAESVHGMSEADLLLELANNKHWEKEEDSSNLWRRQMHGYKVINRTFITPYSASRWVRRCVGATSLERLSWRLAPKVSEQTMQRKSRYQRTTDITVPLFDWILEFSSQQRIKAGELRVRHMVQVKKSRACGSFHSG